MSGLTGARPGRSDVLVIGAGPVGLLLANVLGQFGTATVVLEKRTGPNPLSRAIGVSPPSLSVLRSLGLDHAFVASGVKVEKALIHGTRRLLGQTEFTGLGAEFRFILSIPQNETEAILEDNLKRYPSVTLLKGAEFTAVYPADREVRVETASGAAFSARFLAACDGRNSPVRNALGVPYGGTRYRDAFAMGDFRDESGYGAEAHLFFTKSGAVESFPLPNGRRRWIVQTERFMENIGAGFIQEQVLARTGVDLRSARPLSVSSFQPERFIAEQFSYGQRVFFCGDAAHAMSPIGGQGMNTGFADAHLCAHLIRGLLKAAGPGERACRAYGIYRKKAARAAAGRAWLSMRIGTIRGALPSFLRSVLIVILVKLLKDKIPPHFAMLTISFGTLDAVKKREKSLFDAD